mmetsp:Transcript_16660/g.45099  ORF Transcript_16660/g.45099 Transcript_16660/m.45099 type:complete len:201 (+) Transcript_16660:218-820(+)
MRLHRFPCRPRLRRRRFWLDRPLEWRLVLRLWTLQFQRRTLGLGRLLPISDERPKIRIPDPVHPRCCPLGNISGEALSGCLRDDKWWVVLAQAETAGSLPLGDEAFAHLLGEKIHESITPASAALKGAWQVTEIIVPRETSSFKFLQKRLLCEATGKVPHHHRGDVVRTGGLGAAPREYESCPGTVAPRRPRCHRCQPRW